MARQMLCVRTMALVLIAILMILALLVGPGSTKALGILMSGAEPFFASDELLTRSLRQDPAGRKTIDERENPILTYAKHGIHGGIPAQGGPNPTFSASNYNPCTNRPVEFKASNTAGTNYAWDFGDGSQASGANRSVTHSYPGARAYNVTLTVTSSTGSASSSLEVFVTSCVPISGSQANWFFGFLGELHFNTGEPLPGNAARMSSSEASIAQSDASGNLLFYSDGKKVWNNQPAVVCDGLTGGDHPTQALSVPDPSNPNSFYLVSMPGYTSLASPSPSPNPAGDFGYTKVSVSAGNVTSCSVNTPIAPPAGADKRIAEMVTAVPGCGTNYWIIVHGSFLEDTDPNPDLLHALFVYPLTAAGVGTPVVFPIVGSALFGQIKASPDGTRIAYGTGDNRSAKPDGSNSGFAYVLDFNRSNGVLSHPRVINNRYGYGLSFSPNSKLLYLTESISDVEKIFQYDLSTANLNEGEQLVADVPAAYSALQLGPDNKIYVALNGNDHLAVINYPDKRNTASSPNACGYSFNGPSLNIPSSVPRAMSSFGLPNMIDARKASVDCCPAITLDPADGALQGAVVNKTYMQAFKVMGDLGLHTFTVSAGTLPPGMVLDVDGKLHGNPITPGTYTFTVRATDVNGCFGEGQYQIIVCSVTTLSPAAGALPGAVVNRPYSQTFTATGCFGPYTFTVSSGSLPPGLILNSVGTLQGTPVTPGTFTFTVAAADVNGVLTVGQYQIFVICPVITLNPAVAALPGAVVNTPYSQTFTATGGIGPYTLTLSGTLPLGIMVDANGLLHGTPLTPGTYTFTVRVADANGCDGARQYQIIISCPAITLNPAAGTLLGAVVNTSYSQSFTATGGIGPYTFTLSSGSLPPGMGLNSAGLLQGTPVTPGTYTFTVRATDVNGCLGVVQYEILVSCPVITLTPAVLLGAVVNAPYSQTLTATDGIGPYTFTLTGGTLPPGMILNSAGLLQGTPVTPGTYTFTVRATDANGCFGLRDYQIVVSCPVITLTPATLPGAVLNTPYSQTLTATGGTGPYTFTVSSGSLPPGIVLNGAGLLQGTPVTPGTYTFTVRATDANGCLGLREYQIIVSCPVITLTPAVLLGAVVNAPYSQTLTATGGIGPYIFTVSSGSLPPGMILNSAGLLLGTPVTPGTYTFTVTAADVNGCLGLRDYQINVTCQTITLNPAVDVLPDAVVNTPYSQTFTTTGGIGASTFTVSGGSLPPGMSLNSAGLLQGTPDTPGLYGFRVTATDSNGCPGIRVYQIIVSCPVITVNPVVGLLPGAVVNTPYSQTLTATGGTGPYTFTLTGGSLPPGMSLNSAGLLEGTPVTPGPYTFTVRATDVNGCFGVAQYEIMISCQTITLNPAVDVLPDAVVNTPYSQTFTTTGGIGASTFTVSSGSLPPGLMLVGGTLQGTPSTPGMNSFTVKATDANGCFGERQYQIVVSCGPISLTPAALPGGETNTPYSQPVPFTATGGTGPYIFTVSSGSLPPGLMLVGGTLQGTPSMPGMNSFTVKATDANGCFGERQYQIVVSCPVITLNPAAGALPGAVVNTPYSQSFTATGGCTSSFTYSVTIGALPPGLTLGANGVLSSTATQAGDFSFSVTATDSCGCSKTQGYTLKVQSPVKTLVISAFRENGPNGPGDEFIEIFNPSSLPVTVSSLSDDPNQAIGVFSSAGNGTASNDVSLRCVIPGATVIKARGWFLCGGWQYSLSSLGGNGGTFHSVPDATILGDIPNDAGLALLNIGTDNVTACQGGNCPTGFKSPASPGGNATVFDKVGFRPYGLGAPSPRTYPSMAPNYCEGTCLEPVGDASTITLSLACPPAVGPGSDPAAFPVKAGGFMGGVPVCYGESGQYAIDRRRSEQQFSSSAGDLHRDTDNNADDFILVAPNPSTGSVGLAITGVSGVSSVLGAAGPHSSSAPPIVGRVIHTQDAFDFCSSAVIPCRVGALNPRNAERRYTPDAYGNSENDPFGTFILRRRFTNAMGSTNGARYRIDDFTTLCGGQSLNIGGSNVATQEARNLRGPDFSVPNTTPIPTCQGEGADIGVFTAVFKALNHGQEIVVDSSGTARVVLGSVLEDTSAGAAGTPAVGRHQPFGGGGNSSFVATTATAPVGDGVNGGTGSFAAITGPQGRVFRIAFKFGVVRPGRFKLLLGSEVQ